MRGYQRGIRLREMQANRAVRGIRVPGGLDQHLRRPSPSSPGCLQRATQYAAAVSNHCCFGTLDCPHSRMMTVKKRSRGAMRPSFEETLPSKYRGRREDRVRAAPAVSCAMCTRNAHEHTGSAETLRPSLRNGFTAYTCSPGDRLSCHHRPLEALASQELDASSGASDHTISPYASRRSSVAASASTAPCPTFVTMANAPLAGQDGGSIESDLPDGASGIFSREGLDRLLVICPSCQFVAGL